MSINAINFHSTKETLKDVKKTISTPFKVFKAVIVDEWGGIYNISGFARRSLQTVTKIIPKMEVKVIKAISTLGLFGGFNVVMILSSIPNGAMKFYKDCKLGDFEGALLSGVGTIISLGDALDSSIKFISSLVAFKVIKEVTMLTPVGLPLGIALLGYSSIKGTYDSIRYTMSLYKMYKHVEADDIDSIKAYLDRKIELTEKEVASAEKRYETIENNEEREAKINKRIEVLKTRKVNSIKRHTDEKIVAIMKNLRSEIEENPDPAKAKEALKDMRTLMRRRLTVRVSTATASIMMLAALITSTVFPIAQPAVFPTIAAGRAAVMAGTHFYNKYGFTRKLNRPELLAQ